MPTRFRHAVIGCGLMGAAAARHLANMSEGVALIGPSEPADKAHHQGVFASHYDEGRITRTIDPDPVWAQLARNSISRYRDIEAATGIAFYREVGSLLTGAGTEEGRHYVERTENAARVADVAADRLSQVEMQSRFPWFSFPAGTEGIFEASGAGHISPRRLVMAQAQLAERAGATRIDAAVSSIREAGGHVVITLADGEVVEAERVLCAAGGFSIQDGLLPRPLDLKVYGRTVTFFEVSEADAAAMSAMPSMIHKAVEARGDIYMLPPIRYPDGKFYLKIGGDPDEMQLQPEQLGEWFRSDGRPHAREHLVARMKALVPGLNVLSVSSASCVTSYTSTGYPAIGWVVPGRIAVVTGGCGAAAKSSDEIGRLGAELVFEDRISSFDFDFSPVE
ncbi:NAD(P)/FAD-dependent oxidoreductase [Rhizobium sp. C4]|uniref:NAD(P)/FAD-dependent oxidoreductase n=1 Tax=Rhizobium sp. C4 TaxID=1349800 RepID=UPI001E45A5A5|nr:FAD-binding oxidoreductase [Rhizobium sp. C4]MCD2173095.1 FAD-binding oxidoreductase [Rhizobium sp. C4]